MASGARSARSEYGDSLHVEATVQAAVESIVEHCEFNAKRRVPNENRVFSWLSAVANVGVVARSIEATSILRSSVLLKAVRRPMPEHHRWRATHLVNAYYCLQIAGLYELVYTYREHIEQKRMAIWFSPPPLKLRDLKAVRQLVVEIRGKCEKKRTRDDGEEADEAPPVKKPAVSFADPVATVVGYAAEPAEEASSSPAPEVVVSPAPVPVPTLDSDKTVRDYLNQLRDLFF